MVERNEAAENVLNTPNLEKHFDAEPITMNSLEKLIHDIEENAVASEHLGEYINCIRTTAKAIITQDPLKAPLVNAKLANINQSLQIDAHKV